jgi:hypothetical protein
MPVRVPPRPREGVAGGALRRIASSAATFLVIALALAACASPAPPPTPTPAPTSTPQPQPSPTVAATPRATLDPALQSSEIEDAFLANVDDAIAGANDLTALPCEDMMLVVQNNPTAVPSLRGYAAALKRLGGQQAALDTQNVRTALEDLDQSMSQLDAALTQCGITQR